MATARGRVARGAAVFAQGVDGKRLAVDELLVVHGVALAVEHEVAAAVLLVEEILAEVVVGAAGELQILLVPEDAVGGGKGPHQARVEHQALGPLLDGLALAGHHAVEAAVLLVDVVAHPEGQDVLQDFLFGHFIEFCESFVFHRLSLPLCRWVRRLLL